MWKKRTWFCVLVMILGILMGMTSMAETGALVRVYLQDNYEENVIVEPSISVSRGEITDVSWEKNVEKWKPGKKVNLTVTVSDLGEEISSKSYKSRCRVENGSLVSANGKDGELVIKIEYYPVIQLGSPEEAGWSSTKSRVAVWKKVDFATGYKLKLYRNGDHVRTIRTKSTSLDLSDYVKAEDSYYYEVCASAVDVDDKDYYREGEYTLSDDIILDVKDLGDSEGSWKNYREGRKYILENGQYAYGWQLISGDWYYFGTDAIMQTGWRQINGIWYYLDQNGVMQTGTLVLEDGTYFLDSDGRMQTGWQQAGPAKWYYAMENGRAVTSDWKEINGKWYYFYEDGTMAFNTVIDGQYALDASGAMIE